MPKFSFEHKQTRRKKEGISRKIIIWKDLWQSLQWSENIYTGILVRK